MAVERIELIPFHCRDSVEDYIERGSPMGDFLTYVFSNDMVHAFGKADDINRRRMFDYVAFLYCHAPVECWGSPEKVKKWIAHQGLSGVNSK